MNPVGVRFYRVATDGSLALLGSSASTGGAALCWNIQVGRTIYGANAGSATAVAHDGSLQQIQTVSGLPAFTTTGTEGIAAS